MAVNGAYGVPIGKGDTHHRPKRPVSVVSWRQGPCLPRFRALGAEAAMPVGGEAAYLKGGTAIGSHLLGIIE